MKPTQVLLPAATGIFGVLLGLYLAPTLQKTEDKIHPTAAAGPSQSAKSFDPTQDDPKTNSRTRARERVEDKKPKEPRVSIPLKTLVEGLRENAFSYSFDFTGLEFCMGRALGLIGTTEGEQEKLKALVRKSKSEMLEAEKSHVKLGEVTADTIRLDMSAMRGPADEIAGRTKDGIRDTLPLDLAEALISAINWDGYYPTDEKSYTRLEITRKPSGKLIAWEKDGTGGTGTPVSDEFKDDGTPLPADQIFPDRWKPFLKGVTILPKDEQ